MEISERRRRENNVILFNVEENDQDLNTVKTTIHQVSATVDTNDLKVYRIGNVRTDNRPRPIIITLKSRNDVLTVLKNKNTLKTNRSRIVIASDQTPLQRKYLEDLRTELATRSNNGEKDLTIKYLKGVPKIISSKN
ncbi:hypothetical protein RI129_002604 [Pyrocoelia pectoralis]|uniref:Uncharacterized protein n=1 Tax=Pyrocoelia pectoralis TaxID=417401 RepID=A0AAN7VGV3_9COLE